MTTGTKAQVVGKALYIELTKDSWTDDYYQVVIIPNLPDELGRKRDNTLIFTRTFYGRYSRNSWSNPTRIATSEGLSNIEELRELAKTAKSPEVEQGSYYSSISWVGYNNNHFEVEQPEEPTAEQHSNKVVMELIDTISRETSTYDRMGAERGENPYPKGYTRSWSFDKVAKTFSVEVTDRDMLELYNDSYKIPSAVVNRIKQARMRIV